MSTTTVPYQAYKSKRHSRVLSNTSPPAEANGTTGSVAGPQSSPFIAKHALSHSMDVNPWGKETGLKANTKRMSFPGVGAPAAPAELLASSSINGWLRPSGDGAANGYADEDERGVSSPTSTSNGGLVNGNGSAIDLPQPGPSTRNEGLSFSRAPSSGLRSTSIDSVTSVNGYGAHDDGDGVEQRSPSSSRSVSTSSAIPTISLEVSPAPAPTPTVILSPSVEPSSPRSPSPLTLSLPTVPEAAQPEAGPSAPSASSSSSPSPPSPSASAAPASASAGASTSYEAGAAVPPKPPYNARKSSTFRHVPLRVPSSGAGSTAPRTSSPLRPPGQHTRTLSAAPPSSRLAPQPHPSPHRSASALSSPVHTASEPQARTPALLAPEAALPVLGSKPPVLKAAVIANAHQRSYSAGVGFGAPSLPVLPPQRTSSLPSTAPPLPPPKPNSPSPTPSALPSSVSSPRVLSPSPQATPSTSASSASSAATYKAAYRPGFQPKGVYRPRTDEFLAARAGAQDRDRIERARLERRFEKLVDLHFSASGSGHGASEGNGRVESANENGKMGEKGKEKLGPPAQVRRASSLFERIDFGELRTKSASDLWKGVLESRASAAGGGKGDIRSAEQKITPWQDDADVSACPLCSASFHPLTNRKHHCRLCGRIICSLPVKRPQRPEKCSLLFVADPKSGRIEEVNEVVDYGVRPRSPANGGTGKGGVAPDEKTLKGVRICRDCKPIMQRQQYRHEAKRSPLLVRLYEAFIALESEIEDALPHFQELMLSLSNNLDEAPTKEASAMRKHLLQCFADYDALAKRIAKIPCPGGAGSSQERVQSAIALRANMFLQKNMFPLQSLPRPKRRAGSGTSTPTPGSGSGESTPGVGEPGSGTVIDPDSELARALQPLLEQEALLESFIEEARAHRKFEDVQTLKANLGEIRAEIDRIVARADASAAGGGGR